MIITFFIFYFILSWVFNQTEVMNFIMTCFFDFYSFVTGSAGIRYESINFWGLDMNELSAFVVAVLIVANNSQMDVELNE